MEGLERLEVLVEGSAVVFWAILDPDWVEDLPVGPWVDYSPPGSEVEVICLHANADAYLVWA